MSITSQNSDRPHIGVRGFRWGRIPGCYVTKFAPHTALKLIAQGEVTLDERVVHHRVEWSAGWKGGPSRSSRLVAQMRSPLSLWCVLSRSLTLSHTCFLFVSVSVGIQPSATSKRLKVLDLGRFQMLAPCVYAMASVG